jgi:hypothetical protein
VSICVYLWLICLPSCASKPTDLRSLAPSDSLIYVETNDLGAALQPIVDSKSFSEAAVSKPDLSAIHGVQLAIAVTGFETSEQQTGEGNFVLNFTPHFVAIADTHTWQWQTNSFAADHLGEFVNKVYGGGVQLETVAKNGGTEYVWTAEDGRKVYGFVIGSLILFGNDASSIENVQAVRRGDVDPISKTGKVPTGTDDLAVGYVSTDGIGQIANIVGAQKAKESSEEAEVQSFVARVLPQMLRGAIREVTWTARKSDEGIEDKLGINLNPDIATVLNETLAPADARDDRLLEFAPVDAISVTQYGFKDAQVAWRSVLLATQRVIDPASSSLIASFSNSFFEPYGIKDGELFLGSVFAVMTVRYEDDDDVAVVAIVRGPKGRANALDTADLKQTGANVQINDPGFENIALNGSSEVVAKCIQAHQTGENLRADPLLKAPTVNQAAIRTMGLDRETAVLLAAVLSERRSDEADPVSRYIVETRFNRTGMERRLVSEFGLISLIVTMLSSDQ